MKNPDEKFITYNAVMVDLETMSTANNASVMAIGAVKFSLNTKQDQFSADQMFYTAIDLQSSEDAGLHISADTIRWWMTQSKEAQDVMRDMRRKSLPSALNAFLSWYPKDAYLFGNGATFDNIILRNAFKAVNIGYPVSYRYDVCYRTIAKMHSDVPFARFEGIEHHALDDAKAQTWHLMDILEKYPWLG